MALIQIYTNMEMMLIRMTSAFNQMLLLHCFLMSFLGLLSDVYNHDVEFDLTEENLVVCRRDLDGSSQALVGSSSFHDSLHSILRLHQEIMKLRKMKMVTCHPSES